MGSCTGPHQLLWVPRASSASVVVALDHIPSLVSFADHDATTASLLLSLAETQNRTTPFSPNNKHFERERERERERETLW